MSEPITTRRSWMPVLGSAIMSPIGLWAGFVLVHLWLVLLNLEAPGRPLSDVLDSYAYWMGRGFDGGHWVGIDSGWVYPIVALLPLMAARVIGGPSFPVAWLAIVTLLDAIAFAFVLGRTGQVGWRGRSPRAPAAWWWLGFLVLLGPIALARLDSISVSIAIVGIMLAAGRPAVASIVLTVATWIKVWPAAIILAMVISASRRWRIVVAAVAASVVIAGVALAFGSSPARLLSFVGEQAGRGLQIEAPITTPWLWLARTGAAHSSVYFDTVLATYQVHGDGVGSAAAIMTPVLAVAFAAIILLGVFAVRRGTSAVELLPVLSLALVTAFIALNKVGSPQYVTWLAVPVILGLASPAVTALVAKSASPVSTSPTTFWRSFRIPAALVAGIALLTQLIYPYFYGFLVGVDTRALLVITAKDLLLFALLAWSVYALVSYIRVAKPRTS
ncbi:MAG: hypothetical protein JWO10_1975 [Microbacteriaceae bacterium]|nr:hypothetical protein [Microbacteriaceae bacterium]